MRLKSGLISFCLIASFGCQARKYNAAGTKSSNSAEDTQNSATETVRVQKETIRDAKIFEITFSDTLGQSDEGKKILKDLKFFDAWQNLPTIKPLVGALTRPYAIFRMIPNTGDSRWDRNNVAGIALCRSAEGCAEDIAARILKETGKEIKLELDKSRLFKKDSEVFIVNFTVDYGTDVETTKQFNAQIDSLRKSGFNYHDVFGYKPESPFFILNQVMSVVKEGQTWKAKILVWKQTEEDYNCKKTLFGKTPEDKWVDDSYHTDEIASAKCL